MFVAFACVPPGNGWRSREITRRLARNVAEEGEHSSVIGKTRIASELENCANGDKKKKQATISRLSVLASEST
jgi:hypothetical protein